MADGPTANATPPRRRKSDGFRPWLASTRVKVRKWMAEEHSPFWRFALLFASALASALLLSGKSAPTPVFRPGEIAPRTVFARTAYRIRDEALTATKRQEAERSVRPVYDFDPKALPLAMTRLAQAFDAARTPGLKPADTQAKFSEAAGISDPPLLRALSKAKYDAEVERDATSLLGSIAGRRIVARADLASSDLEDGIVVRDVGAAAERILHGAEAAVDVESARTLLADRAPLMMSGEPVARRELAVAIAAAALRPNLTFNAAETEGRRKKAREAVNEVFVVLQKGRAIVEAGHEVTDEQARLLGAMRSEDGRNAASSAEARLGLFALAAGIFAGVWAFGKRYMRHLPTRTRDLAVLASLVLLGLVFARLAHVLSGTLADRGALFSAPVLRYALPAAASTIVAAVLFGADGAALVATATALLAGLALDGELRATIYVLLGSVAAAVTLTLPQRRRDLLTAGLAAGVAQMLLVAAFSLFQPESPMAPVGAGTLMLVALVSGLASGAIALGLLPAYEAFGYLTNFQLLELASLGSPLLKELSVQAPGTYHHSVVVGSLAEAAAEEIGANPLFARVACYYHDIGKMRKPQYFIENQQGGENLHDRLTPSMSALVVESHVKDGIEMGLAGGLPKAIVDVIPQHHGTKLISFFYKKAKDAAEKDPALGEPSEIDFRYPGPRPQTREAGIIMLADGTEAATRSITDPTPARIRGMVQKVFAMIQQDGQLDECDLSLKDLARIAAVFEKVLLGMHHRRVAYPATAEISGAAPPNVVQMRLPLGRGRKEE